MRFINQRDQYSCGPVAILNALKWAGLSLTYKKNFKEIKKLCKTTISWGTTPENISKVLSLYKNCITFEVKKLITLKDIEKHLSLGGAVILEYWFKENEEVYDGHYVFIFNEQDNFIAANSMEQFDTDCYKEGIKFMLRCKKYRYSGSPSAWLITKKQ